MLMVTEENHHGIACALPTTFEELLLLLPFLSPDSYNENGKIH